MKKKLFTFSCAFATSLYTSSIIFSQAISVDVSNIIRTIPSNAVGINMNYLMDGTYINSNAQSATANALKNMGMKFLRYPGGEKSDNYLWATSPYSHANPTMTLTGSCQWPSGDSRFVNSDYFTAKSVVLDFDEFVTTYKQVGAEPMIVCAYDAAYYGQSVGAPLPNPCGTKPTLASLITNAKEWVKYANVTKGYNIKYWCIGNESWNTCDYNGCVSANQYATDIVTFASAMKSIDPTIKIIANGRGTAWWKTLLESSASGYIDYLGVSCYPIYNYTGGYETYRISSPNLLSEAQTAVNAINTYTSATDKQRIKVITTEFNSIDFGNGWSNANDVGHALVAFDIMGQHLKTPQIDAALFWNTRWVNNTTSPQDIDDALDKNSSMNANGLALSIWGNNLLPKLINATSSGIGSNFIKVFSNYDDITNRLNIFLINKDNVSRTVNLNISNYVSNPFYQRYQYAGSGDLDKFPSYDLLDLAPLQIKGYPSSFVLPKNSITLFRFGMSGTLASRSISLNADLNNNIVNLSWVTGPGSCASDFFVQSCTDGLSWSTDKILKADCILNNYSFEETIETISAKNIYYRIKEIDKLGVSFYSDVKVVRIKNSQSLQINLYNNPAANKWLELSVLSNIAETGTIFIISPEGNILKKIFPVQVNTRLRLDIRNLASGIYIIQVMNKKEKVSKRFLKT
ncbi:MAG: T9SS type A sorting domain-containing protein [Ginsengibacter sp.]